MSSTLKKALIYFILVTFLFLFFSYRLLDVPKNLTLDEEGFGYNAVLLGETLRDETGRFLPIFALSLDNRDYRQPIAQYYQVLFFKVFGASVYNFKFTSVTIIVLSAVLIFILGKLLFNLKAAIFSTLFFISTPVIMIHSHLGLDNIYPIPFILIWLITFYKYEKSKSLKYLIISGASLGVAFYAHKSMRSASTLWSVLTVCYLFYLSHNQFKNNFVSSFRNSFKPILFFIIGIAPFFMISPILDNKYGGAVFGFQNLNVPFYHFMASYLNSFDPSFLFVKGDAILHHSTGKHGVFLLAGLPLFLSGLYQFLKDKNRFLLLIVISFFIGPLFLGFIGATNRASRLIFLVPLYSIIAGYGTYFLYTKIGKKLLVKFFAAVFILLFLLNLGDFLNYYWFKYGDETYHIFYHLDREEKYKSFYEEANSRKLEPYFYKDITVPEGDEKYNDLFLRSIYFPVPNYLSDELALPSDGILFSATNSLKSLKLVKSSKDGSVFIKQ